MSEGRTTEATRYAASRLPDNSRRLPTLVPPIKRETLASLPLSAPVPFLQYAQQVSGQMTSRYFL